MVGGRCARPPRPCARGHILFGSDFPLITPDRWMADFEMAGFQDAVNPLIPKHHAMRRLDPDTPATA